MEKRNFNEALKEREARQQEENARRSGDEEITLDDASRVKVLSPGMLVFKRFIRNKLAIVGTVILLFMFAFAFLGPFFYKYGQTQVFNTFKPMNINYASAVLREEHSVYPVEDLNISSNTKNMFNSIIASMEKEGKTAMIYSDSGDQNVVVEKLGDNVYVMGLAEPEEVGVFSVENVGLLNKKTGRIIYAGEKRGPSFEKAVKAAAEAGEQEMEFEQESYMLTSGKKDTLIYCLSNGSMAWAGEDLGSELTEQIAENLNSDTFRFSGDLYQITPSKAGVYTVSRLAGMKAGYVSSTFVFDTLDPSITLSEDFKAQALLSIYSGSSFSAGGETYSVKCGDDGIHVLGKDGNEFADLSTFVVRRFNGEDSLDLNFKTAVRDVVADMRENNRQSASFHYELPQLDENGQLVLDESGKPVMTDSELTVNNKVTNYVITCEQMTYMLDRYSPPSKAHPFGTDGDGMDILARMMAGGRISLLVGFIVVILETILGIIMGGLAGYFGGWVDNLIMRLVDIFYCIPSMPILIILGSLFDSMRMTPYLRLIWLMAVLGILGWASIARLVRGQILSLREQDFMVATEATGLPVARRIFRHLIPNVMPQLIVSATMGLGSIILTESTLSFLGLGVKHPMATWGTMINSVASNAEAMVKYTYIWVPVGFLICLTVIAFNFVGDGLRDAFDPKMKQ